MAINENIGIGVNATDNASATLKNVNKELKNTGEEAKTAGEKLKRSWTEMNQSFQLIENAVGKVWRAIKEVYSIAREGADLDFMASKFDNLTASIGTTTEALLRDLREASDGTLSDMQLMTSATDFLALGLANSHEEVVRLSTVSSQLGMDMNELVLTLTNQTTRRFDQLGVSVAGFDEKVQALKDSGMEASAAFNEAFLQQAEEQIERVGSATEESIGSFMRLEAAWANATDTAKRQLVPAFEGVAEAFANMLTLIPDNVDELERLTEEVKSGKISYEEYKESVDDVLDSLHIEIDAHGELKAVRRGAEDGIDALKDSTIYYSEAAYHAALQTQLWKADSDAITESLGNQEEATIEVEDATNNAVAAMKKYSEQLLFQIASQGLNEYQALQLAYAMGLVDEKTVYATQKAMDYKTMLDEGIITLAEYNQYIVDLDAALEGLPRDINIDVWLKAHGLEGIQQIATMGGGGGEAGAGSGGFVTRSAGGGVRPGQTVIVGESGPEILQMGQNGGHIYPTNVTNNFNLGVTTLQNANSIQTAFAIMQAMA